MIVAEDEEDTGQQQQQQQQQLDNNYNYTAGAPIGALGATRVANKPPELSESEQRMNALYTAQSTFGGHPTTAEELVKRAEIIRKYLHDGVSA
jgi:hypothetical protein